MLPSVSSTGNLTLLQKIKRVVAWFVREMNTNVQKYHGRKFSKMKVFTNFTLKWQKKKKRSRKKERTLYILYIFWMHDFDINEKILYILHKWLPDLCIRVHILLTIYIPYTLMHSVNGLETLDTLILIIPILFN